ncbi:MAG: VacJ family lipoprotein [Myxococcota bacterium]|nr:VacJ family lipoprotein [Myxococcota bacterium]
MRPIWRALAPVALLVLSSAPALGEPPAGLDPIPLQSPEGEAELPDPLFDDFDDVGDGSDEIYDPFEGGNRMVLRFNQGIDRVLWSPLTKGYRLVFPDPARRGLRRALANLNTPVYMVNNLLQLRPRDAAENLAAFALNTVWGVGGLFDAASAANLQRRPADFGQTLAKAGIGHGPYLVLPIFGPATLRDGFGWVVDRAFHPLTYVLGVPVQLVWRGGAGVAQRDAAADALEALEESSLDFYAVLRSAYIQSRDKEIADR